MALVKWSDWYEIGVPTLDRQHESLFEALNRLHDAVRSGIGHAELRQTLDFLVDYTQAHFRDEEAHMADSGYPDLAEHRLEHVRLVAEALERRADFVTRPEASSAEDLAVFLVDWVTSHIIDMDKRYADWHKRRA